MHFCFGCNSGNGVQVIDCHTHMSTCPYVVASLRPQHCYVTFPHFFHYFLTYTSLLTVFVLRLCQQTQSHFSFPFEASSIDLINYVGIRRGIDVPMLRGTSFEWLEHSLTGRRRQGSWETPKVTGFAKERQLRTILFYFQLLFTILFVILLL